MTIQMEWQTLRSLIEVVCSGSETQKTGFLKQLICFNYLPMEFTVDSIIIFVDQLECVTAVAVHPPIAIRGTTVREQH